VRNFFIFKHPLARNKNGTNRGRQNALPLIVKTHRAFKTYGLTTGIQNRSLVFVAAILGTAAVDSFLELWARAVVFSPAGRGRRFAGSLDRIFAAPRATQGEDAQT
jgi:hypothetical protein